ncbi:MAG: hypothetical protein QXG57_08245 [Thermofilaceae archaeon]
MASDRVEGTLKGGRAIVPQSSGLAEKGYGVVREEGLELTLVEAAYLLDRGELSLADESGRSVSLEELARRAAALDPGFWVKLNVYTDLRSRGLRALPLEGAPVLLVERRSGEGERRYLVLCLEEGVRIGFKELEAFIRRALESKREPVLAIVDKEGNVSYYTVEKSMG